MGKKKGEKREIIIRFWLFGSFLFVTLLISDRFSQLVESIMLTSHAMRFSADYGGKWYIIYCEVATKGQHALWNGIHTSWNVGEGKGK